MINFKFKFPDKTVECLIPENWEEMTVKQAIAFNLKTWSGDPLTAIARLAGVKRQEFNNLRFDKTYDQKLKKAIAFLASPPPALLEARHKEEVDINGTIVKVPKDLMYTSFGQAALFPILQARPDALAMIAALYLQPLVDGKLGEIEDIERFAQVFDNMLFIDVFPLVNFFFLTLREYRISGQIGLKQYPKPKNKRLIVKG